jgi:cyclopropane-fatty-acyl-phospholipid synthase
MFESALEHSILFLYNIYAKFAKTIAWVFLPITKWYIHRKLLALGINVNGPKPNDPQILSDDVYLRIVADWDLGILDSIVDGKIKMADVIGTVEKFMLTRKTWQIQHPLNRIFNWLNLQTPEKAWEVGKEHYDLGVDIWEPMFGEHQQYSCGYWKNAKNLLEAQEAKLHLIAQKLKLQPGMKVLDIGCGWGGLSKFLATNYGVSVVGYTISAVQKKYAEEKCKGLPVQIRLDDYRTINEKFDRVVSVGMFEHVGAKNYKDYFDVVCRAMDDDGIFLLHTMAVNHSTTPQNILWIHKHIFRNGYFPYHVEIAKAIEDKLIIEDWHNMGHHYYLTYKAWEENLEKVWPKLEIKYGAKFRRIWTLYLQLFQAMWRSRTAQLWQIVLTKDGLKGGYESVR